MRTDAPLHHVKRRARGVMDQVTGVTSLSSGWMRLTRGTYMNTLTIDKQILSGCMEDDINNVTDERYLFILTDLKDRHKDSLYIEWAWETFFHIEDIEKAASYLSSEGYKDTGNMDEIKVYVYYLWHLGWELYEKASKQRP